MTEEEEQFQSSNTCWICEKHIDDEQPRDYCHITGKFRGAAQQSCKIYLHLTKKAPEVFHNLRGYGSHLKKVDVKITVIPNRLEKGMAFFFLNKQPLLTVCSL